VNGVVIDKNRDSGRPDSIRPPWVLYYPRMHHRLFTPVRVAGFVATLLLASCARPVVGPEARDAFDPGDAPLPHAEYRRAIADGDVVYTIDPLRSRVLARVGRDGPMKNLGHDHAIASEDVAGYVLFADDPAVSRADIAIPLTRLIVDGPGYRTRFGLDPEVPESAIAGTARNMQDKVLESELYPWVTASARFASADTVPASLAVSVTLRGTTHEYLVPVALNVAGDELAVNGSFAIRHGDFAMTPFSAAGGLLRVAEQIDVEFALIAVR